MIRLKLCPEKFLFSYVCARISLPEGKTEFLGNTAYFRPTSYVFLWNLIADLVKFNSTL